MYQNNDNNNSNSVVGGNSYHYFYQQQPPAIGMEGDRSLQRITEQPLPQEIIHQDRGSQPQQNQERIQPKKPFLLSQQNDYLQHQNMMVFDSSNGGSSLNGNGNSNFSSMPPSMNHPLNGYYYDYSNTAVSMPQQQYCQNPQQPQQLSHFSQNVPAVQPHPFSYYNRSHGSNESPSQPLNSSLAMPSSLMLAQKYQNDHNHVPASKVTETKYVVTRNGPLGSKGQENAAASFFAKTSRDQIRLQHNNHSHKLENRNDISDGLIEINSLEEQANTHLKTKNLHSVNNKQNSSQSDDENNVFPTNFCKMLKAASPAMPNAISKKLEVQKEEHSANPGPSSSSSCGKIRVILRVANSQFDSGFEDINENSASSNNAFQLDRKRRQVTLYDPSFLHHNGSNKSTNGSTETNTSPLEPEKNSEFENKVIGAPKMFAFDGVFNADDSQEDIATAALTDIVAAVLNGNDGCLFCYGHANLGKSRSMLGSDEYASDMGLVPISIAWLYRAIKERKVKTGARFSIRVSALEITSQRENVRDLLASYVTESDQPPGAYLRQNAAAAIASAAGGGYFNSSSASSISTHLQNQSEIRAPTVDKAAYYLDAALAGRSADVRGRESHLVYTIHVYQYSVDPSSRGGVTGGRSRMHLIDFGGCERTKQPGGGGGITLSGLGNVILGIFNGQKVLPHRDSKVTQILRECLGSISCHATMVAHVSPDPCHYSETLHTVQLASRLHRMRRKRMKGSTSGSRRRIRSASKGSGGNSSGHKSTSGSDITTESGTSTNASSSEFSCDTVVYRGANGSGYSDGSGTDGEHPPMHYLRSAASSREGSIRGSLDEIPRPASAGSRRRKILTNGAISPRQCLSPSPRSPAGRAMSDCGGSRKHMLPAIPEVVSGDKMPLSGLVPIQSNHRYRQLCHINNLRQQQRSQKNEVINIQRTRKESTDSKKSEEIWIDCDPTKKAQSENAQVIKRNQQKSNATTDLHSSAKKRASYGYMDNHKAQMINSWVENQTNPVDIGRGTSSCGGRSQECLQVNAEMTKGSSPQLNAPVLNPDCKDSQPEFKALTQFKTIDTSDDGGGSSIMSSDGNNQVKAQIHQPQQPMTTGGESPACISYLESDITKVTNKCPGKPIPPPPPPRKTSPRAFRRENNTIDVGNNKEQDSRDKLVGENIVSYQSEESKLSSTINNASHVDTMVVVASNQDLSQPNLVKNSGNRNSYGNESFQQKTRSKKPNADNMLYYDQRQSYHEDDENGENNHPLRVLSESNLTVVSSFGGSLNDVDVEECEMAGEDIATKLSYFKLPDMPQSNSSNFVRFDDNVIDQRFKEFERLHNQENVPVNEKENSFTQISVSKTNKPLLSTFAAKSTEKNGRAVVELGEYVCLNDTRESNISNLYCEPFNPNVVDRSLETRNSNLGQTGLSFVEEKGEHIHKLPSPNFRYNLPSRSLQPEPDGSSNPEINLVGKDLHQPLCLPPLNSGDDILGSSSTNTNRLWDSNRIPYNVTKSSSFNDNDNVLVEYNKKSPNNNTNVGGDFSIEIKYNNQDELEEEESQTKESFGSRFLRLFGSKRKKDGKKRSKSCESGAGNFSKQKPGSGSSVAPMAANQKVKFLVDSERNSRRSASASPDMLIGAGRKISNQKNREQDVDNEKQSRYNESYDLEKKLDLDSSSGNNSQNTTGSSDTKCASNFGLYQEAREGWVNGMEIEEESIETNFNHIIIQKHPQSLFYGGNQNCNNTKRPRNKHRKSSGYDSLDGDEESSSLDSAISNQNKINLANSIKVGQIVEEDSWVSKLDPQHQKMSHINIINNKNMSKSNDNKNSSGGVFKRFLSKHPSKTNSMKIVEIDDEHLNLQQEEKINLHIISEEPSRKSFTSNIKLHNCEMNKAHITKPLGMEIIQYDETDILRMDFRSKQPSSTASTTNNSHSSSTYSSSTHS